MLKRLNKRDMVHYPSDLTESIYGTVDITSTCEQVSNIVTSRMSCANSKWIIGPWPPRAVDKHQGAHDTSFSP